MSWTFSYAYRTLRTRDRTAFARLPHIRCTTRAYSTRPMWLESLVEDTSPPPRLFAWGLANLEKESSRVQTPSTPSSGDERRIFVLGVGNLGRLFASSLAQTPDRPPVTLVVHRKELLSLWAASDGIEISRSGALSKNKDFDIEWWTDVQPDHGPVRQVADGGSLPNLLITTKASAALPQVDRLRRYLGRNSTVAFAQNGMCKFWPPHGPAYIAHRYPASDSPSFLACVTTHGVTSQGPFRSVHASVADVAIGPVLPSSDASQVTSVPYLSRQIVEAPHLEGRQVSRGQLWVLQLEKLVVNSTINPLTAILRCKNGALFAEPDGAVARVIDQLLREVSNVLLLLVSHDSSAGIRRSLSEEGESSPGAAAADLRERFSYPRLRELVYRVGHVVKDNTSSMLQDVRAGRPTEIGDFNGWVVETAALVDPSLDVPGHRALVDLVTGGITLTAEQLESHLQA